MEKYENSKGINKTITNSNNVIYFIRHGEYLTNIGQIVNDQLSDKLTKNGENQAIKCGKIIKSILNIYKTIFYTSNMERAIKTGEIIADILNINISKRDDQLNEISHCLRDKKDGVLSNINIFERIDEVIAEIWNSSKNMIKIIVTYQGLLELLICRVISKYYTGLELPSLHSIESDYEVHSNTGISTFKVNENGKIISLISWNQHNHIY
jgi:broad specificity phosphatase PhoE|tara:strand:- start:284 stop:913 length:630 start_codon:yes stop_codon:yes gene_type:complete